MISRRGLFRLAAQGLLAGAAYCYVPSVLARPRVSAEAFAAFNQILKDYYLEPTRQWLNSQARLEWIKDRP